VASLRAHVVKFPVEPYPVCMLPPCRECRIRRATTFAVVSRSIIICSYAILAVLAIAAHAEAQSSSKPPRRLTLGLLPSDDTTATKRAKPADIVMPIRIEAYDTAGRLVFLSLVEEPASASEPAMQKREFVYDAAGRLVEISKGGDSGTFPEKRERIRRDEEGRPLLLTIESGDKTAWRIEYAWNGSGSAARLVLRDGTGALAGVDVVLMSGGAGEERAFTARRMTASGELVEERIASLDASGNLSRLAMYMATSPEEKPEGIKNRELVAVPGKPGARSSTDAIATTMPLPPPGYLLMPAWPDDGPWKWGAAAEACLPPLPFDFPGREMKKEASDNRNLEQAASSSGAIKAAANSLSVKAATKIEGGAAKELHPAGVIDFLRDDAGRLLRARLLDPEGGLLAEVTYRYDGRGLLVEETHRGGEHILYGYRLSVDGTWTERRSFRIPSSVATKNSGSDIGGTLPGSIPALSGEGSSEEELSIDADFPPEPGQVWLRIVEGRH
jgi:hypothetical protein